MDELTKQERIVLQLITEGWNNVYISNTLFLSKRTVEQHINHIFAKLKLNDESNKNRRVSVAIMYYDYKRKILIL